jgi:hypothetical protein
MKQHEPPPQLGRINDRGFGQCCAFALVASLLIVISTPLCGQSATESEVAVKIEALTQALERTQSQLEQSQRELKDLREQLLSLEQASKKQTASTASASAEVSENKKIDDLSERQAIEESQIATHEQAKVESASKYPVKVTGLMLFNGFVNTRQVDVASTPTVAAAGAGSTGATIRQTILGFDAQGPHILGATSFADLRVDFGGSPQSSSGPGSYSGPYAGNSALLRLRTAHAGLQWTHTQAFFALDRPIFSPDSPTSLAAVAEPALAWSGNLWTWNPQLGLTHDWMTGPTHGLRLQGALIDAGDTPITPVIASGVSAGITTPSSAEQSRWPGVETRLALIRSISAHNESHFGLGGYFAPHRLADGKKFDSWAATIDSDFHLPAGLEFTGSAYRGLALGGLGGGAYKDITYYVDANLGYYIRPLDSVGGWAQLKERASSRLEFNEAFGADMVFAHQLRPYVLPAGNIYQNLDATRTFTGNVIFSPTASLLFSLEYRRLASTPASGSTNVSNILGIAAGYKF